MLLIMKSAADTSFYENSKLGLPDNTGLLGLSGLLSNIGLLRLLSLLGLLSKPYRIRR